MTDFSIAFFDNDGEELLLTWYPDTCPPFIIGQSVWLQTHVSPTARKVFPDAVNKPLTEYRIEKVDLSVNKDFYPGNTLITYACLNVYLSKVIDK